MKSFILCLSLLSIFGTSIAQVLGGKQPVTDQVHLGEIRHKVSEHLKKLDGQASGGNLELVQIHHVTSQKVAGTLYDLSAKINENKTPVNCTIQLWEKPCMDFVKLDVECGEEKRKYSYASHPNSRRRKHQIGTITIDDLRDMDRAGLDGLYPKLETLFNHLNSQYPDFNTKLKHIGSGKFQDVSGTAYLLKVKVVPNANPSDEKSCVVEVLENSKGQFKQAEVRCGHLDNAYRYTKH